MEPHYLTDSFPAITPAAMKHDSHIFVILVTNSLIKRREIMSQPSSPYYHKEDSDTYHWETSCSLNNYPGDGWERTYSRPSKEQCEECKSK
jgi:hypothetical protein